MHHPGFTLELAAILLICSFLIVGISIGIRKLVNWMINP